MRSSRGMVRRSMGGEGKGSDRVTSKPSESKQLCGGGRGRGALGVWPEMQGRMHKVWNQTYPILGNHWSILSLGTIDLSYLWKPLIYLNFGKDWYIIYLETIDLSYLWEPLIYPILGNQWSILSFGTIDLYYLWEILIYLIFGNHRSILY